MSASPDSIRDAYALVQCSLTDDHEGADVITTNAADIGEVAGVLADRVAEALKSINRALSDDDPLVLLEDHDLRLGYQVLAFRPSVGQISPFSPPACELAAGLRRLI